MTEIVLIFHALLSYIALRILTLLKLGLPKYGISCWGCGLSHIISVSSGEDCRGIFASMPGACPLPPASLTWCLLGCFSHILTPVSCCNCEGGFCHFLNLLSQRRYCWWAPPWPVADPSWSQLALASSAIGEASRSFCRSHPCSPPSITKTLASNTKSLV